VTPQQARELFSAAYDSQLSEAERRSFDALLEREPELSREYAAFCATLAALGGEHPAAAAVPDVLRGVQKRLRNASAGRYYADRFAERSGVGKLSPIVLLIVLLLLLGLGWLGFELLTRVRAAS
jgi:anti-sigma factor RsiW